MGEYVEPYVQYVKYDGTAFLVTNGLSNVWKRRNTEYSKEYLGSLVQKALHELVDMISYQNDDEGRNLVTVEGIELALVSVTMFIGEGEGEWSKKQNFILMLPDEDFPL